MMIETNMAELLRSHFEAKRYSEIGTILQDEDFILNECILTELEAELTAIAAFSLFNIGRYREALSFANHLISHLKTKRQIHEARELYENLVIVAIDCYISLHLYIQGFRFLKLKIGAIDVEKSEVLSKKVLLEDIISDKILSSLKIWLPIAGFISVLIQLMFHVWNPAIYMLILTVFIAAILCSILWPEYIKKAIKGVI